MIYLIIAVLAGGVIACLLCRGSDNWRDGEEIPVGEKLVESAEDKFAEFFDNLFGLIVFLGLVAFIFWVCADQIR